jgi:hypothetical protein
MKPSHTLKIESLNEQWRDKDSVMLHACFQLLKDAIEQEKLFEVTDWDVNENTKATKRELSALYHWWITYKESEVPEDDMIEQNKMLHRLIDIRWALWT